MRKLWKMNSELGEWRDIEGYEGLYQVSNLGEIRSLDRHIIDELGREYYRKGVFLRFSTNNGYYRVPLKVKSSLKNYFVHRLVAEAFIPNPDKLPQVNHINEDKTDNRVENLEWCTAKYNINYGTRNEKVSLSKTEWWNDESRRKWMSESKMGEKNPNYGNKYTSEEIEAIRKRQMKKVYQYTIDGVLVAEYESAKEATMLNGFSQGNISKACKSGRIRYGYRWSYERI